VHVCITGITGLLGTALAERGCDAKKIKGVYLGRYGMPDSRCVNYSVCDVADKKRLFDLFGEDRIDCIIHAAGISDTDSCEKEPEKARISNVTGTKNLIELANQKQSKFVYISTNAVFDGEDAPYDEDDAPNPINIYGMLKLECERLVAAGVKEHLVIRPILMYGLGNPRERKSFLIRMMENLKDRKTVFVVDDIYENHLLSYQCADLIWRLIDMDARGIYHAAGRDILTRYEAVKRMAGVFGLDESFIKPVSSEFFSEIAPRPKNTSYKTQKIEKKTGQRLLGLDEGLLIVKERMAAQVTIKET
jgi:dTDP-4-dehydrorhamnose reductase